MCATVKSIAAKNIAKRMSAQGGDTGVLEFFASALKIRNEIYRLQKDVLVNGLCRSRGGITLCNPALDRIVTLQRDLSFAFERQGASARRASFLVTSFVNPKWPSAEVSKAVEFLFHKRGNKARCRSGKECGFRKQSSLGT
jgi:hypothetical protein